MDVPEVRYARSGAVNIAFQVVGAGPVDLLNVPGWISHLDLYWEEPGRSSMQPWTIRLDRRRP